MSNELEIAFKSGFQKEAQENQSVAQQAGNYAVPPALGAGVGSAMYGAVGAGSDDAMRLSKRLARGGGLGAAAGAGISGITGLAKWLQSQDVDEEQVNAIMNAAGGVGSAMAARQDVRKQ